MGGGGKGRGGNEGKGKKSEQKGGSGEANVCIVIEDCIYIKATRRRTVHLEQSLVLPVLSPATLVGCSVGRLMVHHVLFSW